MGILLIYKYSGLNTFDILVLREQAKLMNIPVLGTTLGQDHLAPDLLRLCLDCAALAAALLVSRGPRSRPGRHEHVARGRADEARPFFDHPGGL